MWWLYQSLPHVRHYHFHYVVRTYSTYSLRILLSAHVHMYFFMISRRKYTKNVLVGSPAVLIRDEIHCNEYPGTRRVMNVGYPGSKFSTRFNPTCVCMYELTYSLYQHWGSLNTDSFIERYEAQKRGEWIQGSRYQMYTDNPGSDWNNVFWFVSWTSTALKQKLHFCMQPPIFFLLCKYAEPI